MHFTTHLPTDKVKFNSHSIAWRERSNICVKINVGKIRIFPLFGPRLACLLHYELKFRRNGSPRTGLDHMKRGKHCLDWIVATATKVTTRTTSHDKGKTLFFFRVYSLQNNNVERLTVRLLLPGSLKQIWPIRLQHKNSEFQPKLIEPITSRRKTTVKTQNFGIIHCSYHTMI